MSFIDNDVSNLERRKLDDDSPNAVCCCSLGPIYAAANENMFGYYYNPANSLDGDHNIKIEKKRKEKKKL